MVNPSLLRELARTFVPRAQPPPIKLAEFAFSALPKPSDWRWCVVAVTDRNCAAVSNGTAWLRADGSAL